MPPTPTPVATADGARKLQSMGALPGARREGAGQPCAGGGDLRLYARGHVHQTISKVLPSAI